MRQESLKGFHSVLTSCSYRPQNLLCELNNHESQLIAAAGTVQLFHHNSSCVPRFSWYIYCFHV